MIRYIILLIFLVVWLYILHVTKKAKLPFWHFLWGSAGLFVIIFVGFKDKLWSFAIFIDTSITLKIDFECSGIIEITAFLSLLIFFNVYSRYEKVIIGCIGTVYIIVANALRIILICLIIHFKGVDYYYISHALIGRIFFYILSIILYFYVFTKAKIISQKVGGFGYVDDNK